jgi:hypothetical protein
MTNQPTQTQSDVNFVREVIARSEDHRSPGTVLLLWAALILVGFPLVDFAPRYSGLFWMIAGPVGGVVSFVLGRRESLRSGLIRKSGFRYTVHWLALMGAILLLLLSQLSRHGAFSDASLGQIILLIVALTYVLAGVHLDRPLLWAGLLMAVGYVVLLFVATYTWTIIGVVVSIGMVLSAVFGGRKSAATEG